MKIIHLGAGAWQGEEQTECGLESPSIGYSIGLTTCEKCLQSLFNRGIEAANQLTTMLRRSKA